VGGGEGKQRGRVRPIFLSVRPRTLRQ
jgi:hypothetical protein